MLTLQLLGQYHSSLPCESGITAPATKVAIVTTFYASNSMGSTNVLSPDHVAALASTMVHQIPAKIVQHHEHR